MFESKHERVSKLFLFHLKKKTFFIFIISQYATPKRGVGIEQYRRSLLQEKKKQNLRIMRDAYYNMFVYDLNMSSGIDIIK